jgi:hypothetical protein
MKIAMVFDGLGVGGIERVGIDYMKLLSEDGHDVTVYNLVPSANAMESEIEDSITIRHNSFPRKVCPEMYVSLVKRYSWGKYVYIPIDIATNIGLAFSKLIKKNRKETYDFAIAFSGHYNDLKFVASDFIKAKHKICWLHGSILDYALLSSGFLMLYKKIGNLVSLSSFYDNGVMTSNKWLSDINIRKIYNPTFIADRELDECKIEHLRESYGEFLLMVGRFTKGSGYCDSRRKDLTRTVWNPEKHHVSWRWAGKREDRDAGKRRGNGRSCNICRKSNGCAELLCGIENFSSFKSSGGTANGITGSNEFWNSDCGNQQSSRCT